MKKILLKQGRIVNEGAQRTTDVLIEPPFITKIDSSISDTNAEEIDAEGLHLLPGAIDDQVHFREPGLTHKAEIETESRAAAAGGVTSYMEMPNTNPQTLTQELLEEKYQRAAAVSAVNYSFYMGASNENLEAVLKTDAKRVCGVKVFMGSSTGNMLVDDESVLRGIFSKVQLPIATHCEKEAIVRAHLEAAKRQFGEEIPIEEHPSIRSREACLASSSQAVALAKEYGSRLHVLHISTAEELQLFEPGPVEQKRITAEACIHHLWFSDEDYGEKGAFIKWNPAVKSASDRAAIRQAVNDTVIDVIATDHAPHTIEEKSTTNYSSTPSGGPLVQHGLVAMLELTKQGVFTIETVVDRMAHQVARLFEIDRRGFIREGHYADLVLVNLDAPWTVSKANVLAKCGWSPFEGQTFSSSVVRTLVNGETIYENGRINGKNLGQRLSFLR